MHINSLDGKVIPVHQAAVEHEHRSVHTHKSKLKRLAKTQN
ncbi:hypothetical protein F652_646 [Enterobacteriaceae bacterium bta3-1]|nr:hypothetical protein F652_646 [Enterobacteriaceae bacterium bta3-1]